MDKNRLVRELGKRLNVTQNDISVIIDEFSKIFNETLAKGEQFKLQGLFSVKLKAYKPYKWRDPNTKQMCESKPYYKVMFKLNEKLQNKIDKMKVDMLDLEEIGIDPLDYD